MDIRTPEGWAAALAEFLTLPAIVVVTLPPQPHHTTYGTDPVDGPYNAWHALQDAERLASLVRSNWGRVLRGPSLDVNVRNVRFPPHNFTSNQRWALALDYADRARDVLNSLWVTLPLSPWYALADTGHPIWNAVWEVNNELTHAIDLSPVGGW